MVAATARSTGARRQWKEADLSDQMFEAYRKVIYDITAIKLSDTKREFLVRRLGSRVNERGLDSFEAYLELIKSGEPGEVELFCNAVTTNLTSFFREKHHFEYLASEIIPEVVEQKGATSRRLRIWSAGCSTGEEPYSIAMTVRESFPTLNKWDAKILCTDLDSNVVAQARAGVYPVERFEKVPVKQRNKWFRQVATPKGSQLEASQSLKDILTFKQLNLMESWPMKGPFDVIFCRNVIIYFDKPTQRKLLARYAKMLEPGSWLILGHSESIWQVSDDFELVGNTVYRKI